MAVFYHPQEKAYAFVSFKALYSRFCAEPRWEYLDVYPTWRMLANAIREASIFHSWFLVRSPYDRTISCFMDKFRKQPKRINEEGFQWQHCHLTLFPHLQISDRCCREEIAERFLSFTFDQFMNILPRIYALDGHFKPQHWTVRLCNERNRWVRWPFFKIVRVEDAWNLTKIPGIDFSIRTNTTGHIEQDFKLAEWHRSLIRTLYEKDFRLGKYDFN